MRIRNNVASLNALRYTNQNLQDVKGSIEKLSSGLKINRAQDGPAGLIASERLRGAIVGLQQAHSNTENSLSMVQTAESSLNGVSEILIRLKQLTVHAANEAVNDDAMLQADQIEVDNLLESLHRIAQNTSFGHQKLLNGDMGVSGTTVGNDLRFDSASPTTPPSPKDGYEVDITQVATQAKKKGLEPLTVENIGEGLKVVINEGGRNAEFEVRGQVKEEVGKIVESYQSDPQRFPKEQMSKDIRTLILFHLQNAIDDYGVNLDVFEGPDQTFTLRHRDFGEEPSFSVTSDLAGLFTEEANVAEFSSPGLDVAGTINREPAFGKAQYLTAHSGSGARGVTVQYSREIGLKEVPVFQEREVPEHDAEGNVIGSQTIREQVGMEFVEEAQEEITEGMEGYVHIAQQSKHFNLGPKGEEAMIDFGNVRIDRLGQDVRNESGFKSLSDLDLTFLQGARDSNQLVERAIDEVTTLRGKLGAFQKHTIMRNLDTLKVLEENTVAGESVIRDADMAAEMSALTGNQIMLQASQSMLAQANQLPRNVVRLIEGGGTSV